MYIDLTLQISKEIIKTNNLENKQLLNHFATHFDIMDKIFPLEYIKRDGIIFNKIGQKLIDLTSDELNKIKENSFVLFNTGFINKVGYFSKEYSDNQPEISTNLIFKLIEKKVSIIGLDFKGVKKGSDHRKYDQLCADNNLFIVENLTNLDKVSELKDFIVYTFPLNYTFLTGVPCRVVVEK